MVFLLLKRHLFVNVQKSRVISGSNGSGSKEKGLEGPPMVTQEVPTELSSMWLFTQK